MSTPLVLSVVARRWNVRIEALVGPRRDREVVVARQVAMYLLRRLYGQSLKQIGAAFGGRDHSTVHYSIRVVESGIRQSEFFGADVSATEEELRTLVAGASR